MSYAAEGDIRRYLGVYAKGWPPPAGNPPTVADGLAYAATASGTLDSILNDRGVVTPVTVPQSFVDTLRDLAAIYAAMIIVATLFPQAAGPGSTTLHEFLRSLWETSLKDLRRGDMLPGGLILLGTELARSYWTTNPYDEDGVETTIPAFTRRMQW